MLWQCEDEDGDVELCTTDRETVPGSVVAGLPLVFEMISSEILLS